MLEQTQQQKPKPKKRLFWIILGIIGIIFILLIVILLVASFFSQQQAYRTSTYDEMALAPGAVSTKSSTVPSGDYKSKAVEETEALPTTAVGETEKTELSEQKVIKTGNLTLIVEKVGDTVSSLNSLAVSKNGFILSSTVITNSDKTQSASVILKVPVSKFEEAIEEIKKLAKVVELENLSGQDVTEQYTDLQSQLKNYKAEEEQYLEILKKATTIDDILKVTQRLSVVRGNIERIQGQIKYLESQTDMSTISITLKEETRVEVPTKEWRPLDTLKKAFRSWIVFLQGGADVLIWLVIYLGPAAILFWLIIKWIIWKKRKRAKKEK